MKIGGKHFGRAIRKCFWMRPICFTLWVSCRKNFPTSRCNCSSATWRQSFDLSSNCGLRSDSAMLIKASLVVRLAIWFCSVSAMPLYAATQLESLTVGYASFTGHYTPMWIAVEDGLGRKYGLDLKAVYAGRMRPQQLLVSGDVPIVIATGSGALTSHIVGAKEQVIVANFINKAGGAIYAQAEIKNPEDLRRKTIGIRRAGSSTAAI